MRRARGLLVLLAVGPGVCEPAAAEAEQFSGRLPRFTAETRDNVKVNTVGDELWRTVPGMWVDVTTTVQGPATATFCAEIYTSNDERVDLRVFGGGERPPGWVQVGRDVSDTYCFTWFATLAAGTHRISVQWSVLSAGAAVIRKRSLRVEHQG